MPTQNVPNMTPVPPFPALSERAAGTYNTSAYAFGNHMAVTFNGELLAVAMSAQHNAEQAEAFSAAASSSASAATTQADAALGYRNTANAAAATATAQAGIATTKAGESAASAVQASKLNLGDKSAPPTTDNQGQPLRAGATYFDTALSSWRVWSGAAWFAGVSPGTVVAWADVTGKPAVIAAGANAASARSAIGAYGITDKVSLHTEAPIALAGGVIDCSIGNTFTETVSANRTLAFSNIPTGVYSCVLEINHTAGAITFPAGTVWAGTAPTLTAGKRHLFFFQRCQLGTAGWYVSALPGYST